MSKICKKTTLDNGVSFGFVDGEILTCALDDLSEDMVKKLALHGLSQKVGDSYSGAQTVSEAQQKARAVWESIKQGVWAAKAAAGGGILAEAVSRALGITLDDAMTRVNALSDDERKALRKHSAIDAAAAEINAEKKRAKAGDAPDLDALLDGLQ